MKVNEFINGIAKINNMQPTVKEASENISNFFKFLFEKYKLIIQVTEKNERIG